LTFDEISEVLGISERTVKREWSYAKAWLYGFLKRRAENAHTGLSEK
jgi:DNA-directed RNA polymerase specialized sigma24 family protein